MKIRDVVFVYRLVGGERLAWHGRYHAHATGQYEFHYFLEGQGAMLLNRAKHRIEGDKLFLVGPGEFHSILPEAVEKPLSYYAVLFEPEEGSPADEEILALLAHLRHSGNRTISVEARDRFLLEDLYRLFQAGSEKDKRAAEFSLMGLLFRWYGSPEGGTETGKRLAIGNQHVERALALMRRSVREKLGSGEIAGGLGLSEEHFIRLFRKQLGMSPFQYFTRLKIEAASAILVDNSLTISDVAERFGFENPFHFSRVFRKCTGLSPREYRRIFVGADRRKASPP